MKTKFVFSSDYIMGMIISFFVFCCTFSNRVISGKISFLPKLQSLGRYGLILFAFFMLINFRKKPSITTVALGSMICVIMMSSVIFHRALYPAVYQYSYMLLICLSFDAFSSKRQLFLGFLDVMKYMLLFVVLLDVATQIAYPKGMYKTDLYDLNWFLGYKTERTVYSLPMVILFIYTSYLKNRKIDRTAYYVMALAVVNGVLSQGSGCTLVFAFLLFLMILIRPDKKRKGFLKKLKELILKFLDYRLFGGAYVFLIAIFVIIERSPIMSMIASLFGKSDDFSGRTQIWHACLSIFTRSPLFGCGHLQSDEYVELAHMHAATNPHNAMLSLLVTGGIINMAIYIFIFCYTLSRRKDYKTIDIAMIMTVYSTLVLGLTSSIIIFSTFSFLPFWILETEKKKNTVIEDLLTKFTG